ncbi:hypothetical protein QTN24_12745 [Cupriavidus sp. SZY C1]|uniref:hypothetical protein n=1 Tax=Cupriavidus sp. SZY C1 TaxID=3055037 RepID=UPI0028B2F50F|nr:hypothetical protein [Cupriavidus sp. SZY C1]MDT6962368.1 hypothetical protein [Cupriavidus sp. SZY C1]
MNSGNGFESIRIALLDLALSRGLVEDQLRQFDEMTGKYDWTLILSDDLDRAFEKDVEHLMRAMKLFDLASRKNDELTQCVALLRASIFAHKLEGFFDDLMSDLRRAATNPDMRWPEIPDGFNIPEEYGYVE